MKVRKHSLILGMLITILLVPGCTGPDVTNAKPTVGRNPQVAETPSADETVRGEDDPPIVTVELGSALHEHRLSAGDELPGNIIIPTTNLNAVPVTAALQAVLAGTDVSLSWDTGSLGDRLVTVVNLSGPLPKVVRQICSSAKVFCNFRHGTLELVDKDTFIVALPPIAKTSGASGSGGAAPSGSANSMVEAINQLINGKAQVDEQGGNILYTADVESEERVSMYLEQLRNGRPLIVLQLYIWEVTLNKENGQGIQWNELRLSDIGPGYSSLALNALTNNNTLAGTSGSVSIGAVTSGRLNTNSLITFLATQGRVQTISNPQVTFISGSGSVLKVGGKQRYISQVGQLVTSNNTSGTSNASTTSGVGTNTVNTDSFETGLTVDVNGSYENGVVFANLELSLTNLVSLNPTTSNGVTIDLPQTSDEKINTALRVRVGDNLVLAGLVKSNDTNTRQGVPIGDWDIPSYSDDQLVNSELVVVVKPSVVLFSDTGPADEAKKKLAASPLPSPVLIDKSGVKTIAVPVTDATIPAAPPTPSPVAVRPELMVPAPTVTASQPIALTPSADGAPVDRMMMQKGFSHAFDEMLEPAPSHLQTSGGTSQ
jgi:Flp pilus assembly secretin CpaC